MKKSSANIVVSAVFCLGVTACASAPTPELRTGAQTSEQEVQSPIASTGETFRQKQPKGGAPRPFQLPKLQVFPLGQSGVTAYLMEQHDFPVVFANLNMEGGSRADARGKGGRRGCVLPCLPMEQGRWTS